MSDTSDKRGNRSVSIKGCVTSSAVVTGDQNTVSVSMTNISLPAPQAVDISAEINAIREVLAHLQSTDRSKIDNALEDAEAELAKKEPDKDELGQALNRALKYAQKAGGFAEAVEKLMPHVKNVAGWLGERWYDILSFVGLGI